MVTRPILSHPFLTTTDQSTGGAATAPAAGNDLFAMLLALLLPAAANQPAGDPGEIPLKSEVSSQPAEDSPDNADTGATWLTDLAALLELKMTAIDGHRYSNVIPVLPDADAGLAGPLAAPIAPMYPDVGITEPDNTESGAAQPIDQSRPPGQACELTTGSLVTRVDVQWTGWLTRADQNLTSDGWQFPALVPGYDWSAGEGHHGDPLGTSIRALVDAPADGTPQEPGFQWQANRQASGGETEPSLQEPSPQSEDFPAPALQFQSERAEAVDRNTGTTGRTDSRPEVIERIVEQITSTPIGNRNAVRLRFESDSLGPVEVRLVAHGQGVEIQFAAGDDRARDVLRAGLEQLRHGLIESGIAVQRLQVEVAPAAASLSMNSGDVSGQQVTYGDGRREDGRPQTHQPEPARFPSTISDQPHSIEARTAIRQGPGIDYRI